jgi:hypothetical protein
MFSNFQDNHNITHKMPLHPTQIFLSNPQALRVEYRLDDQCLELWWSPLAGHSTDCADRNYSSRDAYLSVFANITFPNCGLGLFQRCDYDPYHCILHFEKQTLHLALRPDLAAVLIYGEQPQAVDFKTARSDERQTGTATKFMVIHREGQRQFDFAASLGPGSGRFRHGPAFAADYPRFTRAELAANQLLVIGVGLVGDDIATHVACAAAQSFTSHLDATHAALIVHEASGHIVAPKYPELEQLRRSVIRGLHSMIDESAAYRASLKAIYYLIWVRDSGFSFAYQAAAGWAHKLPQLCRLLLDNPLSVRDSKLPTHRMFGQLINSDLGKLEEDGLYYVVWTLFTQWTQNGSLDFMRESDWALIDEALQWVEAVTWDESRGLFGEYTADETPAYGSRDASWDHAIGQPTLTTDIRHDGQPVTRNYDVYFNICMHSTYSMLAAMRCIPDYLEKAERLWPELHKFLQNRTDGIPTYGELLLLDGSRVQPPYWGPTCGASCCVWGLSMPNFAPLVDWDAVHAATLDAIIAKPDMHFINGICSAMSAVDPWCYDEAKLIALHQCLATEANTSGTYLPMGGAMPEKFNAPQGDLYHDIRPQGFAMGAWLAAWSSLGLRRLAHGLAVRPTAAFERLENYAWRGVALTFYYGPTGDNLALEINGQRVEGTLEIPQHAIQQDSEIHLIESESTPLWLRSGVELEAVSTAGKIRTYAFVAHGLSAITFSAPVNACFMAIDDVVWSDSQGLHTAHFTHFGSATLMVTL